MNVRGLLLTAGRLAAVLGGTVRELNGSGTGSRRAAEGFASGYPTSMPTTDFGKLEKVLRIGEGRRLKRLAQQAAYIAELEPDFQSALGRRAAPDHGQAA